MSLFLSIIVFGTEHQYNGLLNQCITIATRWHVSFLAARS